MPAARRGVAGVPATGDSSPGSAGADTQKEARAGSAGQSMGRQVKQTCDDRGTLGGEGEEPRGAAPGLRTTGRLRKGPLRALLVL